MRINQIIDVRTWQSRRGLNVGYGTRDKVVLKHSNMGKVYFIAKTYENNIGELRSEVCASTIGRLYKFPVQKSWLCLIPQTGDLKLKHDKGALIQLDVRRQRYTKRSEFSQNLVHGLALISSVDKEFDKGTTISQKRKLYKLNTVIEALRNYVNNKPDSYIIWDDFFKLMCFDALIGGTDRHYNNWGILEKAENESFIRFAPAFDNGVSLLWNMEANRAKVMRDLMTRTYEKNAKSAIRKSDGSKYTLYDILDDLYSIPEYRESNVINDILNNLQKISDGFLTRSIIINIPQDINFKTERMELNLLIQYVKIRKSLLIEKLNHLLNT